MKIIVKILKSILVGLGSITPGVSGSMITTSFGFYEELINALDSLTKTPVKAILSVWEYILGILIGLVLGIVLIAELIKVIPLFIMFFFIGLILGSLPEIIKSDSESKKKWYHYLIMIVSILVILSLLLIKPINISEISGFKLYLVYIVIGFFIAIPLIIPGLSGATILMILGFYTYFTDMITDALRLIFNLEILSFFKSSVPILVVGLSALIGLLFAKVIKFLIKNHKTSFNFAVIGLLLVSPVNIIFSFKKDVPTLFENVGVFKIILIVLMFVIGFSATYFVGYLEGRNANV